MNQALILIDIQNNYFPGGANPLVGSGEASQNAQKVLQHFRIRGLPVIHVQHLSVRPGSTFFIPGTTGADIHRNVAPVAGETLITKNFPNSFRETGLMELLKDLRVTGLVVCGMMTHMCIDTTVRAATDLGFQIELIADACATKDLEYDGVQVRADDVHRSFLAAMDGVFATVTTTSRFLSSNH
ncbi:MAG: cysteine hydrolase family protein [Breznakibacter sp.]